MKKYLVVFIAALLVVGMSAFSLHHSSKHQKTPDIFFHYIPNDGSEANYELTGSWEVVEGSFGCSGSTDPCVIIVDGSLLADISDDEAKVQSLVDYLAAQGDTDMTYANATAAVDDFTDTKKP